MGVGHPLHDLSLALQLLLELGDLRRVALPVSTNDRTARHVSLKCLLVVLRREKTREGEMAVSCNRRLTGLKAGKTVGSRSAAALRASRCDVEHWCVCQWAFSSYIKNAGGCDRIADVDCAATNMQALADYESQAASSPEVAEALQCLREKCNLE